MEKNVEPEMDFNPMTAIVDFYRGPLDHLSSVRRGTCPMTPSCSSYSIECLEKHGAVMGWFMACDRLIRCGRDEIHLSPLVPVNGQLLTYDPVEENE